MLLGRDRYSENIKALFLAATLILRIYPKIRNAANAKALTVKLNPFFII